MNNLQSLAARILLAAALSLSWSLAGAVEDFQQAGPISKIGSARFVVENQEYRIAPGATLKSYDKSRRRMSDFKIGDVIIFNGKIISGVYYVDKIIYYRPVPS
jgi:hypothetical protein